MSTRWYPLYQRGSPQLRVFLPNFWLKLIRPERRQPENIVTFNVSMEMVRIFQFYSFTSFIRGFVIFQTIYDVKNYLTNIYKLPVQEVRTRIALGKTRRDRGKSCDPTNPKHCQ